MGVLFIVLAVAMAAATFIENDFGPETARSMVYNTRWFELLFLLLVINLAGQIIIQTLPQGEADSNAVSCGLHCNVTGAAITRYTGYDGMMHIREGETTSLTQSSGSSLTFELRDRDGNTVASHTGQLI